MNKVQLQTLSFFFLPQSSLPRVSTAILTGKIIILPKIHTMHVWEWLSPAERKTFEKHTKRNHFSTIPIKSPNSRAQTALKPRKKYLPTLSRSRKLTRRYRTLADEMLTMY